MTDDEQAEQLQALITVNCYICAALGAQHIADAEHREFWEQMLNHFSQGPLAMLYAKQGGWFELRTGLRGRQEVTEFWFDFPSNIGWASIGEIHGRYVVDEETVEQFRAEIPDSPEDLEEHD